jgi:hypothetical protein
MNKAHFQTMFGVTTGNVYRFLGEIIESQDPVALITEQFISDAGINTISTVVVETQDVFILYTSLDTVVTSDSFEFLTDLVPDPVVTEEV